MPLGIVILDGIGPKRIPKWPKGTVVRNPGCQPIDGPKWLFVLESSIMRISRGAQNLADVPYKRGWYFVATCRSATKAEWKDHEKAQARTARKRSSKARRR